MRRKIPKGATMELIIAYDGAYEQCALLIAIPISSLDELIFANETGCVPDSPLDRKPTADGRYWLINGAWVPDGAAPAQV